MVPLSFRLRSLLRFRLRSLMIVVIPMIGIGVWAHGPLAICSVHGTIMWRRTVPINYGLYRPSPAQWQYREARESLFPNCDDAVLGGSCVGQPTMSKDICLACNAARNAWRVGQTKAASTVATLPTGPIPNPASVP
jgi:hypothetical protein